MTDTHVTIVPWPRATNTKSSISFDDCRVSPAIEMDELIEAMVFQYFDLREDSDERWTLKCYDQVTAFIRSGLQLANREAGEDSYVSDIDYKKDLGWLFTSTRPLRTMPQ